MEKRDASITIKVVPELKEELIQEARGLGITLSEFGRLCLYKALKKDEVKQTYEKEIEKLTKNNNQMIEWMKEQDLKIEAAKKIEKNNEIYIGVIKDYKSKIKTLEKENLELKERCDSLIAMLKAQEERQKNEKIKIGLFEV